MKSAGIMIRREEIEFFLRLHGMWEGVISLPPPPDPPFDIETMEPLDIPISRENGATDCLVIEGLLKHISEVEVLGGIDTRLKAGGITAFIGPNGA